MVVPACGGLGQASEPSKHSCVASAEGCFMPSSNETSYKQMPHRYQKSQCTFLTSQGAAPVSSCSPFSTSMGAAEDSVLMGTWAPEQEFAGVRAISILCCNNLSAVGRHCWVLVFTVLPVQHLALVQAPWKQHVAVQGDFGLLMSIFWQLLPCFLFFFLFFLQGLQGPRVSIKNHFFWLISFI